MALTVAFASDAFAAAMYLVKPEYARAPSTPRKTKIADRTMATTRPPQASNSFMLALTADPVTVARMQRTLAVTNLAPLRPPRLLHLWFGTHPTSPERIAAARSWAAAHGLEVDDLVGAQDQPGASGERSST